MRNFDALLDSLQKGRFQHAYMLLGPEGSGKKDLALKMAGVLLDNSDHHPDLVFLKPENELISVVQIRDLLSVLTTKSLRAPFKVVIIEHAHLMNERAQNAFLKTLEEPEAAIFILLCDTETYMLPTIRSRCVMIRMPICEQDKIIQRLLDMGVQQEKAALCASLSRGSWGSAVEWATDEARLALRRSIIEGIRRLFSKKMEDKIAYAEFLKANKENVQIILDVMLSLFRDMALDGNEGRINLDCQQICERANRHFTQKQIQKIVYRIMKAQREFATNVNYALAVDALLIDLTEDVS